jgi:hypothetical protein
LLEAHDVGFDESALRMAGSDALATARAGLELLDDPVGQWMGMRRGGEQPGGEYGDDLDTCPDVSCLKTALSGSDASSNAGATGLFRELFAAIRRRVRPV